MNEYMMESYFDNISDEVEISVYEHLGGDITDFLSDEVYIEGANLDTRKYYKQYKKDFKVLQRRLKKQVKERDYKNARKTLKECDKKITEGIKIVEDCGEYSTSGSFIFSLFTGFLPNFGRNIAISLIPLCGIGIVNALNLYDFIIGTVNSIKRSNKKGEGISLDNFNIYRNNLIEKMKRMKRSIKKYDHILSDIHKAGSKNAD